MSNTPHMSPPEPVNETTIEVEMEGRKSEEEMIEEVEWALDRAIEEAPENDQAVTHDDILALVKQGIKK